VDDFKGALLVNLREYYEKDGEELPGSKVCACVHAKWLCMSSPDAQLHQTHPAAYCNIVQHPAQRQSRQPAYRGSRCSTSSGRVCTRGSLLCRQRSQPMRPPSVEWSDAAEQFHSASQL